jgi:hypothetical protein
MVVILIKLPRLEPSSRITSSSTPLVLRGDRMVANRE